jgi:hypothetical protein
VCRLCWCAAHPKKVLRPQPLPINQGDLSPTHPCICHHPVTASVCLLLTFTRHLLLLSTPNVYTQTRCSAMRAPESAGTSCCHPYISTHTMLTNHAAHS